MTLPLTTSNGGAGSVFQKHYKVKELAELWHLSESKVTDLIREEEDLVRLENTEGQLQGRRKYVTRTIPESVALRVYERLSRKPLQSVRAVRRPLRIVKLGQGHRSMTKEFRDIVKGNAGSKEPVGEGIA
jgi:hypothetical protein